MNAMLLYKAWRETAVRFAIAASLLAWVCGVVVLFQDQFRSGEDVPFTQYIWDGVYGGVVRELFGFAIVILGLGGILDERARGTAPFTLSLPVSRSRLMLARFTVGTAEVAGLALIPLVAIPLLSSFVGEYYPLVQSLNFWLLWVCGGCVILSLTLVLTYVLPGEYTAAIVAIVLLLTYGAFVSLPNVAPFAPPDVFEIMSGGAVASLNPHTRVIEGGMPWGTLAMLMLISAGFLAVAKATIRHRDF